jgi:excisionase family DNA binding protein
MAETIAVMACCHGNYYLVGHDGAMPAQIVTTETIPTLEELRNGPPTVSVPRAAQYLGVSRGYAYMMARDGRLPVVRLSPYRVRVSSVGLLKMLEGEA